jgi:hypothetical protein
MLTSNAFYALKRLEVKFHLKRANRLPRPWKQRVNIVTLVDLGCHPATPCREVRAIRAQVRRTSAELELGFRLEGNVSQICLTPPVALQGAVELWRHTCFELFVAIEGQATYYEFNFAPSRQWRAYAFLSYRVLDPASRVDRLSSPCIDVRTTDQRLELDLRLVLADLSPPHAYSPLRLGLSAVMESRDRSLSYWALNHPGGKPDFHNAHAFVLRLDPPGPAH